MKLSRSTKKHLKETPERSFPTEVKPMLAKKEGVPPFNKEGWIFEIKWDGWRTIALVRDQMAKLLSRNGITLDKFGPVQEALSKLDQDVVLDGEMVVLDEQGRAYLNALQRYPTSPDDRLVYYAFDILQVGEHDVRSLQLTTRKQILEEVVNELDAPNVLLSKHVETQGIDFYNAAKARNIEGIMAKKATSRYWEDRRSRDWQKMK